MSKQGKQFTLQENEKVGIVGFDMEKVLGEAVAHPQQDGTVLYFYPMPYQVALVFKCNQFAVTNDSLVLCTIERKRGSALPVKNPLHKHVSYRSYMVITFISLLDPSVKVPADKLVNLRSEIIYKAQRSAKVGRKNSGRSTLSGKRGVLAKRSTVTITDDVLAFYESFSESGNFSEGIRNAKAELEKVKGKAS